MRDLIESLWRQTLAHHRFEIVVADNLSTDGTAEMMAELSARSPCAMIYHVMPENRGPARSRNTAVLLARGETLAFTDSDCMPHEEWLERGLAAFESGAAFVTGSVLYKAGSKMEFFTRSTGEVREAHPTYSHSNILYRRGVFVEMGGMDESLCYWQFGNAGIDCGDTDLAWRVREAGYEHAFAKEAVVYTQLETQRPLRWLVDLMRMFVVPGLIKNHPQLRRELLYLRVFFYPHDAPFLLGALGAVLAFTVHPVFAALGAPYLCWAATVGNAEISLRRIPRIAGRLVLLTTRQALTVLAMFYGSVRFRCLVL